MLHGRLHKLTRFRRSAVLLFVAVAALRALVPAGFMPDFTASSDGALKIVLCTPAGLKVVDGGPDGAPAGPHQAPATAGNCAFGISSSSLAALTAADAVVRLDHAAVVEPAGPYGQSMVRHVYHGLGARAPPAAV
jgi:hypothetical protein